MCSHVAIVKSFLIQGGNQVKILSSRHKMGTKVKTRDLGTQKHGNGNQDFKAHIYFRMIQN